MLQLGLNDCSNAEYHADNKFLSSSNLKLLLEDTEQFYKEKILGEKPERKESSSFQEGSLTHSLILEPQLVQTEYAFFTGLRKQGADFDAFAAGAGSKTIISRTQQIRCESYEKAYRKNPTAVDLLKGGVPEQTICTLLSEIPIKVRCDYINIEKGFIADVKTSAYPVDVDTARMTVKKWRYDLSAALYTAAAAEHFGKSFDFYFVFIGKTDIVCEVYRAGKKTLDTGMADVTRAFGIYKRCLASGDWKSTNTKHVPNGEILEI